MKGECAVDYFNEMCAMTGYEARTTFWMDFTIADMYGRRAIQDTFKRAFEEWKDNYEYLTELVMVLNWKVWLWYQIDEEIAKLYSDLWETADRYALDNLTGDERIYFIRTVD